MCGSFIAPRGRSKARGPAIAALILMMRVVGGSVDVYASLPARHSPRRWIWRKAGVLFHVAGIAPSPACGRGEFLSHRCCEDVSPRLPEKEGHSPRASPRDTPTPAGGRGGRGAERGRYWPNDGRRAWMLWSDGRATTSGSHYGLEMCNTYPFQGPGGEGASRRRNVLTKLSIHEPMRGKGWGRAASPNLGRHAENWLAE